MIKGKVKKKKNFIVHGLIDVGRIGLISPRRGIKKRINRRNRTERKVYTILIGEIANSRAIYPRLRQARQTSPVNVWGLNVDIQRVLYRERTICEGHSPWFGLSFSREPCPVSVKLLQRSSVRLAPHTLLAYLVITNFFFFSVLCLSHTTSFSVSFFPLHGGIDHSELTAVQVCSSERNRR